MEQFKEEDEIIKLNCNEGHIFHFPCIEGWALNKNSCPLCRQKLVDEQDIKNANLNNLQDSNDRVSSFENRFQQLRAGNNAAHEGIP